MRETVGGVLFEDGKILLGLRSADRDYYPNTWDTFGGHLEEGETLEQTLVRELEEELGVVPTRFELLGTFGEPDAEKYGDGIHHLFVIYDWAGEPENLGDEHEKIEWFEVGEIGEIKNLAAVEYVEIFAGLGT